LEAAIADHLMVAEVIACAVPTELGEDHIKVSVMLIPDGQVEPEGPFAFFKETLPYYAIPATSSVGS
jgi:crotonobetaine/carnitine-CoA ligase